MPDKVLRIAIVGHPLSGKDVVADYLEKKYGFLHISSGDIIRDYIKRHDLGAPVRELMHRIGNQMRQESGADVLVREACKMQGDKQKLILSGLRAQGEIDTFLKMGGIIVAVDAPIEDRYKRAYDRGRPGDHISFEQFKTEELKDSVSKDSSVQNVSEAISSANYSIQNTGSIEDLYRKTDDLLLTLGVIAG